MRQLIISGVPFITVSVAYASTNKTEIVRIKTERLMVTGVLGRCIASTVLLVPQTFWKALTASVDSWAEMKSAPSVA